MLIKSCIMYYPIAALVLAAVVSGADKKLTMEDINVFLDDKNCPGKMRSGLGYRCKAYIDAMKECGILAKDDEKKGRLQTGELRLYNGDPIAQAYFFSHTIKAHGHDHQQPACVFHDRKMIGFYYKLQSGGEVVIPKVQKVSQWSKGGVFRRKSWSSSFEIQAVNILDGVEWNGSKTQFECLGKDKQTRRKKRDEFVKQFIKVKTECSKEPELIRDPICTDQASLQLPTPGSQYKNTKETEVKMAKSAEPKEEHVTIFSLSESNLKMHDKINPPKKRSVQSWITENFPRPEDSSVSALNGEEPSHVKVNPNSKMPRRASTGSVSSKRRKYPSKEQQEAAFRRRSATK